MGRLATRVKLVITFDRVTKTYATSTRPALDKVSAEIGKGEFVFLIGPSGSGKSTFLRLMVREEKPDSGTLTINGADVAKLSNRQVPKHRQKIGYVFQDFRLLPKKNVFDNVAFALQVIGKSRDKIEKAVPETLDMVGLEGKANRMPHELSGGEQQRVAIARALVNNPDTIIADEPTGNLDPERSLELMSLLVKINELGTTVVVVTHEKDLVDRFGKRVVTIEAGHVINDSVGGYVGGQIHG